MVVARAHPPGHHPGQPIPAHDPPANAHGPPLRAVPAAPRGPLPGAAVQRGRRAAARSLHGDLHAVRRHRLVAHVRPDDLPVHREHRGAGQPLRSGSQRRRRLRHRRSPRPVRGPLAPVPAAAVDPVPLPAPRRRLTPPPAFTSSRPPERWFRWREMDGRDFPHRLSIWRHPFVVWATTLHEEEPMKYLLLIHDDPTTWPADPAEGEKIYAEYMAFTNDILESGEMQAGNQLQPVDTATSVRVREGRTTTTDGPFAETREVLGGYYLVDVKDLDRAIELAARIPAARTGTVEVRPIVEM